jgi:GGDEF domain-containing protein
MSLHRGLMRGPGAEMVEYRLLAAGGGWCPVETTFVAGDGAEVQWVTRRLDLVGAEPQTAAEIDPATGLPTRYSLLDRLAWALHPAGSGAAGVVVIRIDGLERIVEDRGRPGTSVVLRELGRHISSALRPLDLVGQLDEQRLAAVCAGVHDATTVARIAERILEVARRPIGPGALPVIPSIGATCAPAGQRRPAALLQAALQAADDVSGLGGNAFQVV